MSEKNFHFQNSNYQGFNIFNVLIFITLISTQLFSTLEFSRVVKICIFSNCETFKISTFHITPFNPRMFQIFKKFQHLNFYYCKTSYYILPNCILPLTITKPRQNTKLSQHFQDNNLFFIFFKLPIVTGNISQKKKKNKISNDLLFFSIPNEHLCPPHFHLSTSSPLSFHLSFFVLYQSGSKYRIEPTFVFDSQKVVLQRKNIALETVHWLKTEKNDRKGWIKIESCSGLYPRPFFTYTCITI